MSSGQRTYSRQQLAGIRRDECIRVRRELRRAYAERGLECPPALSRPTLDELRRMSPLAYAEHRARLAPAPADETVADG